MNTYIWTQLEYIVSPCVLYEFDLNDLDFNIMENVG